MVFEPGAVLCMSTVLTKFHLLLLQIKMNVKFAFLLMVIFMTFHLSQAKGGKKCMKNCKKLNEGTNQHSESTIKKKVHKPLRTWCVSQTNVSAIFNNQ